MRDINTESDIHQVVTLFYEYLLADERIAFIFTEISPFHLEEHLAVLTTFWSQILLNTGGYTNNMTKIHADVHHKFPLTPELFTIWLIHFEAAVSRLFAGEKAQLMIDQARQLARILQIKLQASN
jgi:hemoglobin